MSLRQEVFSDISRRLIELRIHGKGVDSSELPGSYVSKDGSSFARAGTFNVDGEDFRYEFTGDHNQGFAEFQFCATKNPNIDCDTGGSIKQGAVKADGRKVFNTALNLVVQFLEQNPGMILMSKATKSEPGRVSLYKTMARALRRRGYDVEEQDGSASYLFYGKNDKGLELVTPDATREPEDSGKADASVLDDLVW